MSKPRLCLADGGVAAQLKATNEFEIGLLIGQISPDKKSGRDLILTSVPTPPEEEDVKMIKLQDVSVEWMIAHAKQIFGWLPGGIDCVGMYIVSDEDPKAFVPKLQVHLNALRSAKKQVHWLHSLDIKEENVLYVVVRSPSRDLSAFFAPDARSMPSPVEIQWQASPLDPLAKFTASIELHEIFASTSCGSVMTALTDRIGLHVAKVEEALAIHGEDDGTVIFLTQPDDTLPPVDTPGVVQVHGGISCVAYVASSTTPKKHVLARAAHYLKQDYLKSLSIRLDLIRDNLTTETPTTLPLARRAAFPWTSIANHSTGFDGLLHLIPDDDLSHAYTNACELLTASSRNGMAPAAVWIEAEAASAAPVATEADGRALTHTSNGPPVSLFLCLAILVVALVVHIFDLV
ncbi:Aste57867_15564 [Aphanomyces stellatus]|uniref:Aste57867_15564 protein n=1 Tax=Aphanomyces stellatus TaxID=120398 RepID=A0A485L3F2_9STRA|nr:hypothetical protein As57867_015508 [Aphanomyces stellatus]VFT92366.1 Aste57867_15564 [Aphanomyces stellatus]